MAVGTRLAKAERGELTQLIRKPGHAAEANIEKAPLGKEPDDGDNASEHEEGTKRSKCPTTMRRSWSSANKPRKSFATACETLNARDRDPGRAHDNRWPHPGRTTSLSRRHTHQAGPPRVRRGSGEEEDSSLLTFTGREGNRRFGPQGINGQLISFPNAAGFLDTEDHPQSRYAKNTS